MHFVAFWGKVEIFTVCEEGFLCSQSKYAALVCMCGAGMEGEERGGDISYVHVP